MIEITTTRHNPLIDPSLARLGLGDPASTCSSAAWWPA